MNQKKEVLGRLKPPATVATDLFNRCSNAQIHGILSKMVSRTNIDLILSSAFQEAETLEPLETIPLAIVDRLDFLMTKELLHAFLYDIANEQDLAVNNLKTKLLAIINKDELAQNLNNG